MDSMVSKNSMAMLYNSYKRLLIGLLERINQGYNFTI